ncbi:MAG: 16S rRNA (cytidine(1402)-2'-O)-methyltransferase [Ignavibacteriales bacterium]|nr:16S rRNA (cytidine(1402)-2'-O)-methyltransferase [Ignavibacteriales bacterium]
MLYLVSTPIGNYDDITLRAINVLKEVDLVVCEERKEGNRLLSHYGIIKPIAQINEHNESAASAIILDELKSGKNIALISDCGTPLFSDPGTILVKKAIQERIKVTAIPGSSSLLPALITSGFDMKQFLFYGFLSPKRENRILELQKLRNEKRTFVLMDTPYRLLQVLRDMSEVLKQSRKISVAFNLTMEDETIVRGFPSELYKHFSETNPKGEFVIVVENLK